MKITLLLFLCLITVNHAFSQNGIEHPERDRIPYVDQTDLAAKDTVSLEILSKINAQLSNTSLNLEIGQSNDVILGSVREVEVYNSSEYIVLDERGKRVIVFNESGSVIDTVGRAGQGPGEYVSPYSIELEGDDLYVADRSFSVNLYTISDGMFERTEDFKINVVPDQLCILQDEVFIRGAANNNEFNGDKKVVHVFDRETFSHKRSIVNPYRAEGSIGQNEFNEGQIHCDSSTNSIILSFDILQYIYSFSPDGDLNWISAIDNFQTRRVIEEVGSGSSQSVNYTSDSMYDMITGFTDLDEEIVLVQTFRNYPRSENRFPILTTYALDKSNGNISLIDAVPNNWIVLATTQKKVIVNGIMMNRVPSLNIYNYYSTH